MAYRNRLDLSWVSTVGLVSTVVAICAIQMALPNSVTIGPTDFVPFVELAGIPIVIGLGFLAPSSAHVLRAVMNFFLGLIVLATVMNALLLLYSLLQGSSESGVVLLFAGFGVLTVNVLSFGLTYWWIDGGGPVARQTGTVTTPDFLFPQQGMPGQEKWEPSLMDYLFTAYTNIIAFSPTDTMPLSKRVKVLFTVQSSTAVLTIVVTLSRAINLIPGGTPTA